MQPMVRMLPVPRASHCCVMSRAILMSLFLISTVVTAGTGSMQTSMSPVAALVVSSALSRKLIVTSLSGSMPFFDRMYLRTYSGLEPWPTA